jgi:hypothetical protein
VGNAPALSKRSVMSTVAAANTFAAVECMRYRPRRAYVRDFFAALIGAQRIRHALPPGDIRFAFGGISPLRHDPDIVRRLALGKCRFSDRPTLPTAPR